VTTATTTDIPPLRRTCTNDSLKRQHKATMPAIRGQDSKKKTRRHTRDLDQIHDDMHKEKHLEKYKSTKAAEDLPGLGQFYCVECAKWFESEANLTAHTKAKTHKRR
jgi:bud site selection protein 20